MADETAMSSDTDRQVECILEEDFADGMPVYLVRWLGLPLAKASLQPREDLAELDDVLQEWEQRKRDIRDGREMPFDLSQWGKAKAGILTLTETAQRPQSRTANEIATGSSARVPILLDSDDDDDSPPRTLEPITCVKRSPVASDVEDSDDQPLIKRCTKMQPMESIELRETAQAAGQQPSERADNTSQQAASVRAPRAATSTQAAAMVAETPVQIQQARDKTTNTSTPAQQAMKKTATETLPSARVATSKTQMPVSVSGSIPPPRLRLDTHQLSSSTPSPAPTSNDSPVKDTPSRGVQAASCNSATSPVFAVPSNTTNPVRRASTVSMSPVRKPCGKKASVTSPAVKTVNSIAVPKKPTPRHFATSAAEGTLFRSAGWQGTIRKYSQEEPPPDPSKLKFMDLNSTPQKFSLAGAIQAAKDECANRAEADRLAAIATARSRRCTETPARQALSAPRSTPASTEKPRLSRGVEATSAADTGIVSPPTTIQTVSGRPGAATTCHESRSSHQHAQITMADVPNNTTATTTGVTSTSKKQLVHSTSINAPVGVADHPATQHTPSPNPGEKRRNGENLPANTAAKGRSSDLIAPTGPCNTRFDPIYNRRWDEKEDNQIRARRISEESASTLFVSHDSSLTMTTTNRTSPHVPWQSMRAHRQPWTTTQPCYYFKQGNCKKGDTCNWSHDIAGASERRIRGQAGFELDKGQTKMPYFDAEPLLESDLDYADLMPEHLVSSLSAGGCRKIAQLRSPFLEALFPQRSWTGRVVLPDGQISFCELGSMHAQYLGDTATEMTPVSRAKPPRGVIQCCSEFKRKYDAHIALSAKLLAGVVVQMTASDVRKTGDLEDLLAKEPIVVFDFALQSLVIFRASHKSCEAVGLPFLPADETYMMFRIIDRRALPMETMPISESRLSSIELMSFVTEQTLAPVQEAGKEGKPHEFLVYAGPPDERIRTQLVHLLQSIGYSLRSADRFDSVVKTKLVIVTLPSFSASDIPGIRWCLKGAAKVLELERDELGIVGLRTILPSAGALLLTDDIIMDWPSDALAVMRTFLEKSRRSRDKLKIPYERIVFRPGAKDFFRSLFIKHVDDSDGVWVKLLQAYMELVPEHEEDVDNRPVPADHALGVSLDESLWPEYADLWNQNPAEATRQLTEWFAGWCIAHRFEHRRFIIVHRDKHNRTRQDDRGRMQEVKESHPWDAYEHVWSWTPAELKHEEQKKREASQTAQT